MPDNVTNVDAFLPLDQEVWQAWLRKNRLDERAYSARWQRRLGLFATFLAVLAALYFFYH